MFRKKQITNLITNLSIDNSTQKKIPKHQKYCISAADYDNNIIQIKTKNLLSNNTSNKNKKKSVVIPTVLPSSNNTPLHLKKMIFTKEINEDKNSAKKLKIISPYSKKDISYVPKKNFQTPNKIKLREFKEFRDINLKLQKEKDVNELSNYYENLLNEKELIIQKLLKQIKYYKKLLFKNNNNIIPNLNLTFLSEESANNLNHDNPDSNRSNSSNLYITNYKQIYQSKNTNQCKSVNSSKLSMKLNKGEYNSYCTKNEIQNSPNIRNYKSEYINSNKNMNGIYSERKTLKGNNSSNYKLCLSPSFLYSVREIDNTNTESQVAVKNNIFNKKIISFLNSNEKSYVIDNRYKNSENNDFKNFQILLEEIQFRMLSLFDNLYGFILRTKHKN